MTRTFGKTKRGPTLYVGVWGILAFAVACGDTLVWESPVAEPVATAAATLGMEGLPTGGFHTGGRTGGPFDPAATTLSISNPGNRLLPWSVETDVSWLRLSIDSGTMLPAETAQIDLSVGTDAANLLAGHYTGVITFTDTSSGTVLARVPTSLGIGKAIEKKSWVSIHGTPFFPIGAWNQRPTAGHAAYLNSLGINTYVINGRSRDTNGELMRALEANDMWAVLRFDPELKDHPRLLGWMLRDEPAVRRAIPEVIQAEYDTIRAADPNHFISVNLSAYIYSDLNFGSPYYEPTFRQYTDMADLISVDVYPVTGWNRPQWLYIPGAMTRWTLDHYVARQKPVWTIVEASQQRLDWTPKGTPGPTPEQMRFEVWDAIINGATGITYFTVSFNPFEWANLTPGIEAEMKRINAQIQDLSAAILSVPPTVHVSSWEVGNRRHNFTVRKSDSGYYVFATNADMGFGPASLTFTFEKNILSVSVYGEGRRITPNGNWFTDDFDPLGVHIYDVHLDETGPPARGFGPLFSEGIRRASTGK